MAGERERGVAVLDVLQHREQHAECNRDGQTQLQLPALVLQQRVMRPRHRAARKQQHERVDERQTPRIERALEVTFGGWCARRRMVASVISTGTGGHCPPITSLRFTMPSACCTLSSEYVPLGNRATSK